MADEPIKAAFVRHFGSDAGWLDSAGSWFTEGYRAALSPREGAQSAEVRKWLLNLMDEHDFSIPVKAFNRVVDRLSTSQAAGVPDGWKLVPIEPTKEMLNAADIDPIASAETGHDEYRAIYAAMLAAAPEHQEAEDA